MLSYIFSFNLYIGIISLLTIYSKSKRKPTQISKMIICDYNICNSLINLYIMCGLAPYVCNKSLGMNVDYDEYVSLYIYLHYCTKYLDFFDTIIMILKQNWKQVNLLQIYHHSTIGVVWYWVWKDFPYISATCAFGAFANSFIHFLMYLHYAITCVGYKNPFKPLMTSLQMSQFTIVLGHSFLWIYNYPQYQYFGWVQVYYMLSMLGLFYLYIYKSKNQIKANNKQSELKIITDDDEIQNIIKLKIHNITYDVTSFVNKHPGGNIIKFYDGLDATDAFNTFHFKSHSVATILKSLPIVKYYDMNKTNDVDFEEMVKKWREKNLFEGQEIKFIIWAFVIFLITITGGIIQVYDYPILGGIITGIGWAHCGFVQHHAGHRAFTGKPEIDYVVQGIFEGILKGGSGSWWRNRHNKHHAMPNMIDYDGDLRTTPFFAWDDVLVKKVPTFLLKIQHLLFLPMLVMYVPVFFITTKLYIIRKKIWDELGLIYIHFILASLFWRDWNNFLTFYIIGYGIQGLYLGIMFGLNHFAMPRINDKTTEWGVWQIEGTCNWGVGSKFAEYISGFLNLQIEHHLAPQMPAENYNLIVSDVKKYAEKKQIKYIDFTFIDAFITMLSGLQTVANDELELRKQKNK